jgi:hypothetical protein
MTDDPREHQRRGPVAATRTPGLPQSDTPLKPAAAQGAESAVA